MSSANFIIQFSFTVIVRVNVMSALVGTSESVGISFVVPYKLFVFLKCQQRSLFFSLAVSSDVK